MIDQRTLALIHAELDGKLSAAERDELAHRLAEDPEASALRADLVRTADALGRIPSLPVPAGVHARILDAFRPRTQPVVARLPSRRMQVARYGFALAAGIAVGGIGLSLLQPSPAPFDPGELVGTMGRPAADPLNMHAIVAQGLTGTVALESASGYWMLVFNMDSRMPVKVSARYDTAGVRFRGYALADSAAPSTIIDTKPGQVGFVGNGSQRLALFWAPTTGGTVHLRIDAAGRTLDDTTFVIPQAGHLR